MTKKGEIIDVLAVEVSGKKTGRSPVPIPGASVADGLFKALETYTAFRTLREQERTKRASIRANRDVALEQIRAHRSIIEQALADSFELRKTGLQAMIRAMDKALDANNAEALNIVLTGMVKTIESSPFKDVADMHQKLSDKNFTLRLE